ncbi:MAG: hypothetical protein AAGB04_31020 [Pseudomonadota bacterium]
MINRIREIHANTGKNPIWIHDRDICIEGLRVLCRISQWNIVSLEALNYSFSDLEPYGQSLSAVIRSNFELADSCHALFNDTLAKTRLWRDEEESVIRYVQIMNSQMSTIAGLRQEWHTAHQFLEKANAPLRIIGNSALSQGIIELHRAQLFLLHARSIRISGSNSPLLPRVRQSIRNILARTVADGNREARSKNSWSWCESLFEVFLKPDMSGNKKLADKIRSSQAVGIDQWADGFSYSYDHRTIRALIHDAAAALTRAEKLLIRQRKNVWWSTWLFELQSKVIEYRLIVNLHQAARDCTRQLVKVDKAKKVLVTCSREEILSGEVWNVMVPVAINALRGSKSLDQSPKGTRNANEDLRHVEDFGIADAPRDTKTELDELVDKTERMVRLDVLRHSRLLETYALCTWALDLLLILDPSLDRIPNRQDSMRSRLSRSIDNHLDRWRERQSLPPSLDPFISCYCDLVQNFALDVVDATE